MRKHMRVLSLLTRCHLPLPASLTLLTRQLKIMEQQAIKGMTTVQSVLSVSAGLVLSRKVLFQKWRAQPTRTQTARMGAQNIALPS